MATSDGSSPLLTAESCLTAVHQVTAFAAVGSAPVAAKPTFRFRRVKLSVGNRPNCCRSGATSGFLKAEWQLTWRCACRSRGISV
jgi:hypothetical protein